MIRQMKDSGIAWIGAIPEGWKVMRLKGCGYLYGGLTGKAGDDFNMEGYTGKKMWYIPYTNIFNNAVINPTSLAEVRINDGETQNLVNKGDLLFLMSSEDFEGVGKPAIIESQIENLGLNSFCKGFRVTNKDIYPKFLYYLMSSHVIRELVRQMAKGFIRINLRQDNLAICPIIIPPLQEQQLIANFLDTKCSEIDDLIKIQEQFIEELKAYKQSVITETVTKGIDPNVEMKDSEIEWIGKIPIGWNLVQLKRFTQTNNGREIEKEVTETTINRVDVYGSGGVFKYTDKELWCGEAVLFGRKGTLGKPMYVKDHFWTVDTMYYLTYLDGLIAKYNYYQLVAFDWQPYITHTAIPSVVASDIVACNFPIPPLQEQQAIASYLDTKCAEIDQLIAIKQQKIAELQDYKKSLIYEYVTGKKAIYSQT